MNDKKKQQVAAVLRYIKNTELCRSLQLVNYFGEVNVVPCGICSVCRKDTRLNNKETKVISSNILALLKDVALSSREISEKLTFTEVKVIKVLQLLVDSGKIVITSKNQYRLK